jgi:hypothetical protein
MEDLAIRSLRHGLWFWTGPESKASSFALTVAPTTNSTFRTQVHFSPHQPIGRSTAEAVPFVDRLLKPTGSGSIQAIGGWRLRVETICKVKASVEGYTGALTYEAS